MVNKRMFIEYKGKDVRDALRSASWALDLPENEIEYKIISKGNFFQKAKIIAREKEKEVKMEIVQEPPKIVEPLECPYITPFEGINSYREYVDFNVDLTDFENQPNVNYTVNHFECYSVDGDFIEGKLFYSGNTFMIIGSGGEKSFTSVMPFIAMNAREGYYRGKDVVVVDNDYYYFEDKKDKQKFLRYIEEYNVFIEKMIIDVQSKSEEEYSTLIEKKEILDAIQNFIDLIPEVVFIDYELYCTMLYKFSDRVTINYLKFSEEEKEKAIQIFTCDGNQEAFNELCGLIMNLKSLLEENFSIDRYCSCLITYMLLNHGLLERYSKIWKEEYDDFVDIQNVEEYIQEYYNKNYLIAEDYRGITALTYTILQNSEQKITGYRNEYQNVVQSLIDAVSDKQKKDFSKQLFAQRNNDSSERKNINIEDIDLMSGIEFEQFICELFKKMGYVATMTKASGDQGLDVIAEKENIKIGIQAKCYSGTVGNTAVQEAVAGKKFYMCNQIIVVTNSYFTKSAIQLASANNVILWDRDVLNEKIRYFIK